MNVAVVSRSATLGGAAVVSSRLTEALRAEGIDATLVTLDDLRYPLLKPLAFLAERLQIYMHLLRGGKKTRRNLWKLDTGRFGLPLWRHPAIKAADAVILNWTNQGMLSLGGLERICGKLGSWGGGKLGSWGGGKLGSWGVGKLGSWGGGKRVVWTMHDMWPMTGICHHAMGCRNFTARCGSCPFLGATAVADPREAVSDLSSKVWARKKRVYDAGAIRFVAVSRWLAAEARASSLLQGREVAVIPNPLRRVEGVEMRAHEGKRILFAAATLDNWIKGLDTFREAVRLLASRGAAAQGKPEVWLMGGVKDPSAVEGFALPVRHLGMLTDPREIAEVYAQSDVIVNTSAFESFGATLAEGQMYGAVPVAFDRGGQSDIITSGREGCLVAWNDDAALRAASVADGISRALEFTEEGRRRMSEVAEARYSYSSVAQAYASILA